jgi:hypothetical protein
MFICDKCGDSKWSVARLKVFDVITCQGYVTDRSRVDPVLVACGNSIMVAQNVSIGV